MLALSLPTLSLQNDFASKTRSRNRSRKLIARSTDTLGCVPPIRRLRLLSASRPLSRTSSFNILTSATHSPRKSFLLRTYEKRPCNPSIMNTSGTKNLKSPAMNTYRKIGGGGEREAPGKGRSRGKKVGGRAEVPGSLDESGKERGSPRGKKVGVLMVTFCRSVVEANSRRSLFFYAPKTQSPVFIYLRTLAFPLLHLRKYQPLYVQSIAHSLPKNTGGGGRAEVPDSLGESGKERGSPRGKAVERGVPGKGSPRGKKVLLRTVRGWRHIFLPNRIFIPNHGD